MVDNDGCVFPKHRMVLVALYVRVKTMGFFRCKQSPFLAAIALLSASIAQAADWADVRAECVAEIEQQAGCTTACVNQTWPEIARCTNSRLSRKVPADKLEVCIRKGQRARERSHTAELRGDPVRDAFVCAGG